MHPTLYGRLNAPAVTIVGTWDPFLPNHQELCEALVRDAHARGLAAAAILLHPSPKRFLFGAEHAPVYDDIHARIWRMHQCGIDAVLKLRMFNRDIDLGAVEFFDVVTRALEVDELWLGARQSLGRWTAGSQLTITEQAQRHAIRLRILPDPPKDPRPPRRSVERLLASGQIAEAIDEVGHPPIWRRPRSGRLHLAWQPGVYETAPLSDLGAPLSGARLRVTLAADKTVPVLDWPDADARFLAFVSGPSDAAAA
ncbi:MAG: hypothetical protein ACRDJE_29385 [Dehalococcoidia bacterium]